MTSCLGLTLACVLFQEVQDILERASMPLTSFAFQDAGSETSELQGAKMLSLNYNSGSDKLSS